MIKFKEKPFFLKEEDIKWVLNTFKSMTLEEKIGQILFPLGFSLEKKDLNTLIKDIKPGGVLFRPQKGREIQEIHRYVQNISRIPLFIAANLESGGNGIATDGTFFGKPLQISATYNDEFAYKLGVVAGREGRAVGVNLSFAPVVDININFKNPITNTRTFGSNPDLIIRMAKKFILGLRESGIGVTIKHFPGDGVDERDQHLLTTINSLSPKEWDKTFGKVYKELIEFGVHCIMVGHIALPLYSKKLNPNLEDRDIMPASLSPELLKDLLRKRLSFNGLIITDATTMLGFTTAERREIAIPKAINSGCDMILFNINIYEDYEYLYNAIKKGVLSEERLDEAVLRILSLKASLGLHLKKENNDLVPEEDALSLLKCPEHEIWAKECADNAITLVRDTQNLLPLSPEKYKKIKLYFLEDNNGGIKDEYKFDLKNIFIKALKKEGFEVFLYKRSEEDIREIIKGSIREFKNKYDLLIYIANIDTASFKSNLSLNWDSPLALNAPWFVSEIPTMFISFGNPYHLFDVPMIKTYINAYSCNEYTVEAVIDKILGKSEFKGKNPVDPFCDTLI